jgi:hypothetical protein
VHGRASADSGSCDLCALLDNVQCELVWRAVAGCAVVLLPVHPVVRITSAACVLVGSWGIVIVNSGAAGVIVVLFILSTSSWPPGYPRCSPT